MGSPGLRERKKQKTRWAIQEHALRLFAEQGYEATTVEQIAAAAEVSPSTFFRYFPTKEDVVVQDEYDPVLVAAIDDAPSGLGPIGALRHGLRTAFQGIDAGEQLKVEERMRLILSVPALRARVLENLIANIELLAAPLARRMGRDAGDLEARAWSGACIGATLVAIDEWLRGDRGKGFAELLDEALAHLESGFPAGGRR